MQNLGFDKSSIFSTGEAKPIEETAGDLKQFLGFRIDAEDFVMSVELVREIVTLPYITYIPNSHVSLEGVIALRGKIMPVVNLRRTLKFHRGGSTENARIVVLQIEDRGCFGLIVDEITDFVWVYEHQIEPLSQAFFSEEFHILSGVAKIDSKVRGIVDPRLIVTVWDSK